MVLAATVHQPVVPEATAPRPAATAVSISLCEAQRCTWLMLTHCFAHQGYGQQGGYSGGQGQGYGAPAQGGYQSGGYGGQSRLACYCALAQADSHWICP